MLWLVRCCRCRVSGLGVGEDPPSLHSDGVDEVKNIDEGRGGNDRVAVVKSSFPPPGGGGKEAAVELARRIVVCLFDSPATLPTAFDVICRAEDSTSLLLPPGVAPAALGKKGRGDGVGDEAAAAASMALFLSNFEAARLFIYFGGNSSPTLQQPPLPFSSPIDYLTASRRPPLPHRRSMAEAMELPGWRLFGGGGRGGCRQSRVACSVYRCPPDASRFDDVIDERSSLRAAGG